MLLCRLQTCTPENLQMLLLPGVLWGVSKLLDQNGFADARSLFTALSTPLEAASFSITQMVKWRLIICSLKAEKCQWVWQYFTKVSGHRMQLGAI